MKTMEQWLQAYGEHHHDHANKRLHWLGIPTIMLSFLGLLSMVSVPIGSGSHADLGLLVVVAALVYYLMLSWRLMLGMVVVLGLMYVLVDWLHDALGQRMLAAALITFAIGWILQFVGHKIEGQKPSFFEDLQFLLIGPVWLLSDLYRRLGLPY